MLEGGSKIPKRERLYVLSTSLVSVLPLDIKLYRDEKDKVFVREEDVKKWKGFKKWEEHFRDAEEALEAIKLK